MPSNATLVAQRLQGDTGALDTLVARCRDRVLSLAFRMLGDACAAEDARQEAFLRVYTRLPLYDPAQSFSTWLMCLTARVCLNARRDWAAELRCLEQAAKSMPPTPTLEEYLYEREPRRTLQRLLMRLPAPQRAAVLLYSYEERPVAEVARALEGPVGTVRTWLYRRCKNLAAGWRSPRKHTS
ncbi:MAG: RNA polymerase sigma factor [bacterium]|nr:RNA polymerase sigma factor [bacterium]